MYHKTHWTAAKIQHRIKLIEPLVYRRRHNISSWRYIELAGPEVDPPIGCDVDDKGWQEILPNTYWGKWEQDFVVRGSFAVPADWPADGPLALYLPMGESGDFFSHPESLVYIDGKSVTSCDRHHHEVTLPKSACDGKSHLLALHGWSGRGGWPHGRVGTQLFMDQCEVVQVHQPTRDLIATARVACQVVAVLDNNNPAKGLILNALDAAFKALDTREPFGDGFYDSVAEAHKVLKDGLKKAGPPMDVSIVATGHAHIDVAWLWTVAQSRRKSGRTFSNVLQMMEEFPDYSFTQSQPQLYDYLLRDYPDLFERIKEKVADGQWELIGGMWVEADCNVSGNESLARQFLLGRSFFRKHFGENAETPVLWLPDVFGYAWNLPQLIKLAGMDYFFTTKLGWSQYNRMPYDSFWWQGLDGTKVLTHFGTTGEADMGIVSTYNANVSAKQVMGTWQIFQQKEHQQELMMSYGFGDGGGGPTREMLENVRELAEFPAMPKMRHGKMKQYFADLEERSGDLLPTWNGELYLEYHRGTYTTQSHTKRGNRKSEFGLHDAEFLASVAQLTVDGYVYPAEKLDYAWKLVCLNQFHDILPGSSITPVYKRTEAEYAEIAEICQQIRQDALKALGAVIGGDMLLVNPSSFTRDDLVFWPEKLKAGQVLQRDGKVLDCQAAEDGTWITPGAMAPFSVVPVQVVEGKAQAVANTLAVSENLLENECLRVEFNKAGDIVSIYDKVDQREVLPADMVANQLQAFEDRPMKNDAWDIDIYFEDKMWFSDPQASIKVLEKGPLKATLEIRRNILNSECVQRVSLAAGARQLDFDNKVQWNERNILLKVAFPVEVLSPSASFEIQWGYVQRPTHMNTSWDWARFETCAQKWVDLSEGDYGVSLLNDCKYGHDIRDNVMRISLLRSPTIPDKVADLGEHRFAYSLLTHSGLVDSTTVAAAYALNDPLIASACQSDKKAKSNADWSQGLVRCDQDNVVIETVKRAEDGQGIIVRFYETLRRRSDITLKTGFALSQVSRVNLIEDQLEVLSHQANEVTIPLKPFEIVTLRLMPA
ncbi:MAG: alpha-mannosidase [Sedimentisphaerales bacterium]|nr:alpha-mannosidase [Sedimentisphaerales bacterium]